MHSRHFITTVAVCCCVSFVLGHRLVAGDFSTDILPILQSHCIRCHGAEKQEGNLRLDKLSTDLINDRAAAENWHDVLNVLNAGKMPPEDEQQLSGEQFAAVTGWVSSEIKQALEASRSTDGRVVMRRLNRVEYQYTMEELLGLDMDYVRDLPPDAISSDGFQNDGRSLQMSALLLEYYLATARRALDRVIVSGDAPAAIKHTFAASNIDEWLGKAQWSNRLGRQQEFLARMVNDYPDDGDFLVRVQVSAELKPKTGFPLLEVSVGYRPDTEILMREFDLVEITSPDSQTFEFRGRLENFPLPVRGQGKYPGLVVRVRNVYDDKSPLPPGENDEKKKPVYPDEPALPMVTIESVEFHGHAYDQWPPSRHRRILPEPTTDREDLTYVSEVLKRFMSRAFRRSVEDSEVAEMVDFYKSIRPEFPSFEEAIRETLAMVLIQPDFLFLLEPGGDEKRPVTELELASRLSYFLWSTMPDDRLLELATAGALRQNLAAEGERMLADQRSQRLVRQFTDQWLNLDGVDNVAINRDRYPGFDDALKRDMRAETHALFTQILRENLSAIQLISADFAVLNEPLAKHYGIPDIFGHSFRRVALQPEQHRGGLLSQASILLSNSTGGDSHPVRRAVWIRDRLLNDPPAPPPPDVPSLKDANPEFHKLSVREQLEIHRTKESCNSCHRNIDPWGIALENFDAVGKWRSEIQRQHDGKSDQLAVNATVVLSGNHEVAGAEGLKAYLATERKREFAGSLVSRLLTYALGRSLDLADREAVDDILGNVSADDYELKQIVHAIILSEPFQTK